MESRLGQIKDPIQRAGVKLLWAAAIPIQTQARRFMARQVAIRRMCAVLTVQAVSVQSRAKFYSNIGHRNIIAHLIICIFISLSADGSLSATLRLQSGLPSKYKRHSEVGSHVIRLKITTIAQHKFKGWHEDFLRPCMSSRICIV